MRHEMRAVLHKTLHRPALSKVLKKAAASPPKCVLVIRDTRAHFIFCVVLLLARRPLKIASAAERVCRERELE